MLRGDMSRWRFVRGRFREVWDNPFRRVSLLLLLSPLVTVWFLNDDLISVYGPTVIAICVLLYLLDPNRDQKPPIKGTEPRPRLSLNLDGKHVGYLTACAFIAMVGLLGLVGAVVEGSIPWVLGFSACCALGLVGMGWVLRKTASIHLT
jgi:hypothetical protein